MALEVSKKSQAIVDQTLTYCAQNYIPAEVVLAEASGVWITDVDGKKYDQLGPFSEALAKLCRMDVVLPMNSGAEAVETAIKGARKWGYEKKGIAENSAEIIVFNNNFHGRTTTIVSFSDNAGAYKGFGPLTPGFVRVPFGDLEAIKAAINPRTAAVLVEPIQGEGGVIIPPDGYLSALRKVCREQNVLFISDEIQTGLCRTGTLFASDREQLDPDMMILGKSLGGGIVPISAVIGKRSVMEVFQQGTHGSTWGGNPFACAIATEVIAYINEEKPHEWAAAKGQHLEQRLREMKSSKVKDIRCRGLMCAIELHPSAGKAKEMSKTLLSEGLVTYHTRDYTLRIAPPLTITNEEIDWGIERLAKVLV
jgi:ornithine--oxo-acid transaminase